MLLSPWVVVNGVGWLLDFELSGFSARGVGVGEGEEERSGGAGKLASLESTAPRYISVASKQTPTRSLYTHTHKAD